MRKFNRIKKGISLIEILMTIVLVTVSLTAIPHLFSVSFKSMEMNRIKLTSFVIAKDLMEEILTKRWHESGATAYPLGCDAGETCGINSRTSFDDIDDYNNRDETPPKTIEGNSMDGTNPLPDYRNYRRRVAVEYGDFTDCTGTPPTCTWTPSGTATDYKRVTVTVEYSPTQDFTNPTFSYNLSQVLSNHD